MIVCGNVSAVQTKRIHAKHVYVHIYKHINFEIQANMKQHESNLSI